MGDRDRRLERLHGLQQVLIEEKQALRGEDGTAGAGSGTAAHSWLAAPLTAGLKKRMLAEYTNMKKRKKININITIQIVG